MIDETSSTISPSPPSALCSFSYPNLTCFLSVSSQSFNKHELNAYYVPGVFKVLKDTGIRDKNLYSLDIDILAMG